MNLLPDTKGNTPNYFSTWAAQNYAYGCGTQHVDSAELEGARGVMHAHDSMNEATVFGPEGWAKRFHPRAKSALYLLLDDGWDVPPDADLAWYGSLIAQDKRFPSCTGTPEERLAKLNQLARDAGWRGIALWIATQEATALLSPQNAADPQQQEAYWKERFRWCRNAGVEYLKADWGRRAGDIGFRRLLTQWAREAAPGLIIEHARCQSCINDERADMETDPYYQQNLTIRTGRVDGKLIGQQAQMLAYTDVLRSYDVLPYLSPVQTIERVSRLFKAGEALTPAGRALINCEDEAYIAAALGLCTGVMRFPQRGLRPDGDMDCFSPPSTRELKSRMDEIARTVRFQKVMPAFGVREAPVRVDAARLTDDWHFEAGQTWLATAVGQTIAQSAPARVSRGLPLPDANVVGGDLPFVLAARHPNGAAAIATIGRTDAGQDYYTPRAKITMDMEGRATFLGVFGRYESLRLRHANLAGKRLFAQDLCGDTAEDVTALVTSDGDTLVVPGALIDRVGLAAATPGDASEPGMLLRWR